MSEINRGHLLAKGDCYTYEDRTSNVSLVFERKCFDCSVPFPFVKLVIWNCKSVKNTIK